MIIERNAMFQAPYEFDMSGLFVTSEGGSSRPFKIYSIIRDSPTLDQVRQMFKEAEGKEQSLTKGETGEFTALSFDCAEFSWIRPLLSATLPLRNSEELPVIRSQPPRHRGNATFPTRIASTSF